MNGVSLSAEFLFVCFAWYYSRLICFEVSCGCLQVPRNYYFLLGSFNFKGFCLCFSFALLEFGFALGQSILALASVSCPHAEAEELIITFAVQMEFAPRQATSDLFTFFLQHGHGMLSKIIWDFNFIKLLLLV